MNNKWRLYGLFFAVLLAINLNVYYPMAFKKVIIFIIENKMRYDLRNENIVVSFSTTPHRINKLQPILENLFDQNVKINNIYINIPYLFKRDNLKYEIPKWLVEDQRVTILRTNDYGPATKLFGALEKANLPPRTIIITVDDDIFYPRNLVLHLAHKATKYPNCAIGTAGADIDYDENGKIRGPGQGIIASSEPDGIVAILLGYGGVAYRADFFNESIFDHINAPKECHMNDDFYIGFYLAKKGILRRNLRTAALSSNNIRNNEEIGWQEDALFKLTPHRWHTNYVCLLYMRSHDPQVIF